MKLRDLARELGLSQTTVSRALNGYPEVNETTRQRVVDAARRYGYRPNASARRLATGRAGAIGAVLPTESSLVDPHYTQFLSGIGKRLAVDDMDIVLSPAGENELDSYRRLAQGTRVDAVILSNPLVADGRIDLLNDMGLPFLLHGRTETSTPHAWLDIDNRGAFRRATRHLLDLGHTRIALVNGSCAFTFARDREAGFREALAERDIACDDRLVAESDEMTDEAGFRLTARFLAMTPPPTALLVSSMMQTLGTLRAIRTAGLELGRDISLIAHDDVFPFVNADLMVPSVSTTRSPIRAAGTRVAELVIEMLQGRDPGSIGELWPVDLIVRDSTGPAPD